MKPCRTMIYALLFSAAALASAEAQFSPLGFGVAPGAYNITRADMDLLIAALNTIDGRPDAKVGDTERWSNPKTGNSGVITLVSTFEDQGRPCHRLVHTIKLKGKRDPNQYLFSRCKRADGTWRIVN